jgi:hypothetical protein
MSKLFKSGANLIDPSDVDGSVQRLLEFHRSTFGSAVMEDAAATAAAAAAAGATDDAAATAAAAAAAGATDDAAATAATAAAAATTGKTGELPDDPVALKQVIADLRRENASTRTTAKTKAAEDAVNDLTQKLGRALGLVKDDEKQTPEQLTKALTETQTTARQAQIELAVFKAAGKHGGDPSALTDSSSFLAKLAGLDPAAADFQSKVDEAIKKAVAENPRLKAVLATGASAVDHAGGPGEKLKQPSSLQAAAAAAYAPK